MCQNEPKLWRPRPASRHLTFHHATFLSTLCSLMSARTSLLKLIRLCTLAQPSSSSIHRLRGSQGMPPQAGLMLEPHKPSIDISIRGTAALPPCVQSSQKHNCPAQPPLPLPKTRLVLFSHQTLLLCLLLPALASLGGIQRPPPGHSSRLSQQLPSSSCSRSGLGPVG